MVAASNPSQVCSVFTFAVGIREGKVVSAKCENQFERDKVSPGGATSASSIETTDSCRLFCGAAASVFEAYLAKKAIGNLFPLTRNMGIPNGHLCRSPSHGGEP